MGFTKEICLNETWGRIGWERERRELEDDSRLRERRLPGPAAREGSGRERRAEGRGEEGRRSASHFITENS